VPRRRCKTLMKTAGKMCFEQLTRWKNGDLPP
jgi:hypothetical protein